MSNRMTTQEFIEKAILVHGNKYDYSRTEYVVSRKKVIIICPEHGEFLQSPTSHLQGNGCPKCARIWTDEHRKNLQKSSRRSRGMTTSEWVERAKSVHGDKYDYSQTVYVNQRTNVKIICPVHGLFEQKADSHLRGCGCRLCGLASENHKGCHTWSDEQRTKIEETCLAKYGAKRYLDSEEGRRKDAEIRGTAEFRRKMHDIISSDEVQEKSKKTSLERYGVEHPMQDSEIFERNAESRILNGNWSSSAPEQLMYELLCDRFGKSDVKRHYNKDIRYPFHCDCYIKSLDLFIELNATWTHGSHWFDVNNIDDVKKVNHWSLKAKDGHPFYRSAYNIWTNTDLQKRETAIKNGINYLVFWDNDLTDFKEWLDSDILVLNNVY